MRTILATILVLAALNPVFGAAISGTVVSAKITTGNTVNTNIGIGDTSEMTGTDKQAANEAERLAIPSARRTEGMTCWQVNTAIMWRLVGGIDNTNWAVAKISKPDWGTQAAEFPLGLDGDGYFTVAGFTPGMVGAQPTNAVLTQLAAGDASPLHAVTNDALKNVKLGTGAYIEDVSYNYSSILSGDDNALMGGTDEWSSWILGGSNNTNRSGGWTGIAGSSNYVWSGDNTLIFGDANTVTGSVRTVTIGHQNQISATASNLVLLGSGNTSGASNEIFAGFGNKGLRIASNGVLTATEGMVVESTNTTFSVAQDAAIPGWLNVGGVVTGSVFYGSAAGLTSLPVTGIQFTNDVDAQDHGLTNLSKLQVGASASGGYTNRLGGTTLVTNLTATGTLTGTASDATTWNGLSTNVLAAAGNTNFSPWPNDVDGNQKGLTNVGRFQVGSGAAVAGYSNVLGGTTIATNLSATGAFTGTLTGNATTATAALGLKTVTGTNVLTITSDSPPLLETDFPGQSIVSASNVVAQLFTGNASGLTNLSASALVGTVDDERLSTNVALLNASNQFGADQSIRKALSAGERVMFGVSDLSSGNSVKIGVYSVPGYHDVQGVWLNQTNPVDNNFTFLSDGTSSYVGAPAGGAIWFQIGGVNHLIARSDGRIEIPDRLIVQSVEIPTNSWAPNTPLGLGTNANYVSSTATLGITGVANLPTTTERAGKLIIKASGGDVTFTNAVAVPLSDHLTSRIVTNGYTATLSVVVTPGFSTNGYWVHQ